MKKTNSHISLEGHPIFIRGLHSWLRSDKNTEELWMNLNKSMNIWILNNPQKAGTHLNRHEVVTIKGLNVSKTSDLNMQTSFSGPADSSECYCLKTDYKWKFSCFFLAKNSWWVLFWSPWKSFYTLGNLWKLSRNLWQSEIFADLQKSSEIFRHRR